VRRSDLPLRTVRYVADRALMPGLDKRRQEQRITTFTRFAVLESPWLLPKFVQRAGPAREGDDVAAGAS
jgi:hypothetical protein